MLIGKPSKDSDNPDYVPSIFAFNGSKQGLQRLSRYMRLQSRNDTSASGSTEGTASDTGDVSGTGSTEDAMVDKGTNTEECYVTMQELDERNEFLKNDNEYIVAECVELKSLHQELFEETAEHKKWNQELYEETVEHIKLNQELYKENVKLKEDKVELKEVVRVLNNEVNSLGLSLKLSNSPVALMKNDSNLTLFWTGIPSYDMFESLFDMLLPLVKPRFSLPPQDQFLLVLMKLRMAVPFKDLSYRFHIQVATASNIFHR